MEREEDKRSKKTQMGKACGKLLLKD